MKCAIFLIEEFLFQDSCLWWKWNDRISLRAVSFITHFFFVFLTNIKKHERSNIKKKIKTNHMVCDPNIDPGAFLDYWILLDFRWRWNHISKILAREILAKKKKREKNSLQYWFEYLNLEWLEYWFQPLTAQGKRMKSAKMCHASSRDPRGNRSRINSDLIIWSNESLSLSISLDVRF